MSAIDLTLGTKSFFVSPQSSAQRLPPAEPAGSTESAHPAAGSVRFEGVGKTYHSSAGPVAALSGIELEIPAGSIFGIIGRSGAGKSSLLRTINRLERPTEGRVLVDGQDIAELDETGLVALRRRIGMIFQHFNLLSAKTVFDNVALPLRVAGVREAQVRQAVAITEADLRAVHGDHIHWRNTCHWSKREGRVMARRQFCFVSLVLVF